MRFLSAIFSIFLFTASSTYGQHSIDRDYDSTITYFKAGISYLSNNVYLGRKDTIRTPYLTPSFTYHNKTGIYATASASYTNTYDNPRIDLVTLAAGWDFEKGNFYGGLLAEKYFYNKASVAIRSSQTFTTGLYAGYANDILTPQFALLLNFGNKTDVVTTIGVNHQFAIAGDHLILQPTFDLNAATQHYISGYLTRANKKKKIAAGATYDVNNKFMIMDYEISMPVEYKCFHNHVQLQFTPYYALPVNAVTVSINNKEVYQEPLSNSFYVLFEVYYRFP